jgi:DNA-binding XRE family transcriptional regulator
LTPQRLTLLRPRCGGGGEFGRASSPLPGRSPLEGRSVDSVRVNAEEIRYWREKRVLTRRELCQRSGIGLSTYADLESGYRPRARVETVKKIAAALQVDPPRLVVAEKKALA